MLLGVRMVVGALAGVFLFLTAIAIVDAAAPPRIDSQIGIATAAMAGALMAVLTHRFRVEY